MAYSSSFELTPRDVGDAVRILVARGDADRFRTDEMAAAIESARRDGRNVVIDLSEVSYLDSSMLATLVAASEHGRRRAETLVVLCKTPRLRRSLELKGLEAILHLAATREEALKVLSGGGEAWSVPEEQARRPGLRSP